MKIRLESNPRFNVPSWIAMAVEQYGRPDPDEREEIVDKCYEVFCEGLRGPDRSVWIQLLSGRIPYTVQGGTVVFEARE